MSKLRLPELTYRARIATRIAVEPTRSISVSFIAAYCLSPTAKRFHT